MATICPCTWTQNFGSGQCSPQTPGVSSSVLVFCRDEFNITFVEADNANPTTTGLVSDIVKVNPTDVARFFTVATNAVGEGFLNISGTESINDNGGKDRNETIVGQGYLSAADIVWMEEFLGKEVVIVAEDNEGEIQAIGWDGGLRLNEYGYVNGQNQGDFKGINFTFTNSTRRLMKFVDLTLIGTHADYDALETYMTT